MRLLAAIDSSQSSRYVLSQIASRPWPCGTTVCALHVMDWSQLPSSSALMQPMRESAKLIVESAAAMLNSAGLLATSRVIEGHRRTAITDYAKEFGADLILLGAHGTSGIVRFLLGSVAQAVLLQAQCSVEIVRQPLSDSANHQGMKIMVTTDGSECAMAAVTEVAQRPWPVGTQILTISVIPPIHFETEVASSTFGPSYTQPSVLEALNDEARRRAMESIARARHILNQHKLATVEMESPSIGDPREVILDQATEWGADLIVLGSHGYHGFRRFMLGSVSESVAIHAQCSVEVIRKGQDPDSKG